MFDVSFLVAFLDQGHVRHGEASRWLYANDAFGWATCPLTENGCLRVLTNPRYTAPQSAAFVLGRLDATKRGGNHTFWPDDVSITDAAVFDWERLQGHQQIERGSFASASSALAVVTALRCRVLEGSRSPHGSGVP